MSYTQSCSASLQSKRAILWLGALPSFSMAVGLFHKVLGAVSARFVASSLLLMPFLYHAIVSHGTAEDFLAMTGFVSKAVTAILASVPACKVP